MSTLPTGIKSVSKYLSYLKQNLKGRPYDSIASESCTPVEIHA